ncbi:MAG TPA: PIG-L family deacetylase [Gemmatimonadales bacterium]|nr:PIG-L family deacetylase [Gemmatimonadales bacterium]
MSFLPDRRSRTPGSPFPTSTRAASPLAESTLVLVAHPDDEVIGAGAQLAGLPGIAILHVTDGAPRDLTDARRAGFTGWRGYAAARRREALDALALARVGPECVASLGVRDQGVAFSLAPLARTIAAVLDRRRPAAVLTHAYEGGHPDHDAVAFAVHAARALLLRMGRAAPVVFEFAGYHARGGRMVTGEFAPLDGAAETEAGAHGADVPAFELSPAERALKRRMLACFRTQAATLAPFGVERERIRHAPAYRFARLPATPPLFYDGFHWGLTSARWPALVHRAARELDLDAEAPL